MNLPQGSRGRLLAVSLLLIPVLVVLKLAVLPGWAAYAQLQDDIAEGQDQLQRYRRIAAELPGLRQQQQALATQQPLTPHLLAGSNRALAAAALQRRLQDLVRSHGGRILSLRTLPHKAQEALEQIPLEVRLQVPLEGLHKIVHELESGRPLTQLDQVNITARRLRGSAPDPDLDVRLTLTGLRAPGPEDDRG